MEEKNKSQDIVICFSCLAENTETAHFCQKCNTPLDNYATTAPYERVFAEGNCILKQTKATSKRQLIATWFFHGWVYIVYLGIITAIISDPSNGNLWALPIVFIPFVWYSTVIIRKAHKNYAKHNQGLRNQTGIK